MSLLKVDAIEEYTGGGGLTVGDIGSLEFNSLPGSSIIQVFSKEVFKRQNLMAVTQTVITTPEFVLCAINDVIYTRTASVSIDLNVATYWASDKTGYATPGSRNGLDIYLYACEPTSGTEFDYVLTDDAAFPAGYTADTSRKVAGFHTLCAVVGTISGHTLSDYAAGDILPLSVWDLFHRSISENTGLVWSEKAGKWTGIYPCSATDYYPRFTSTAKVSTNWMNFVDGLAGINQQLLDDSIFQIIAAGSNEESSYGDSAPGSNSGGFVDHASYGGTGRRMISNIGCESCCGVWYQWLRDQSYQYASTTTFDWVDQTGGKGELYLQGATADVKLLAGGYWRGGADAGSRSRHANSYRWAANTTLGARGCAEPRITVLD